MNCGRKMWFLLVIICHYFLVMTTVKMKLKGDELEMWKILAGGSGCPCLNRVTITLTVSCVGPKVNYAHKPKRNGYHHHHHH